MAEGKINFPRTPSDRKLSIARNAVVYLHRRRIKKEEKAKVVAAVWGKELIHFLDALAIFHQDDLKKKMNRIKAIWWNGFLGQMDDHSVHTTPNQHPTKMDVLPKTFVQIILAAKWLAWHSSTSSSQQR